MVKKGEVYWIRLDPVLGSEIGKTRPALVVSNDINNQAADTITVLPITSSLERVYPFEVLLPKNSCGLQEDSKAKANQIRTIDKKRTGNLIGYANPEIMRKVEQAIKLHLGIP